MWVGEGAASVWASNRGIYRRRRHVRLGFGLWEELMLAWYRESTLFTIHSFYVLRLDSYRASFFFTPTPPFCLFYGYGCALQTRF